MKRLIALFLSVSILMSNLAPTALAVSEELAENGETAVETVFDMVEQTETETTETTETVETETAETETTEEAVTPEDTTVETVEESEEIAEEPAEYKLDESMQTMDAVIASGSCGLDTSWELNSEGVLRISYTPTARNLEEGGIMNDFAYSGTGVAPWERYRKDIKEIIVEDGVSSIGTYAFRGCYKVEKITLPAYMISIGENAFYGCESLKSITLPEGLTKLNYGLFYDCWALETINIPESVEIIDEYAFYSCMKLNNITIPKSVKTILDYAFLMCSALKNVNYGGLKEDWNAIDLTYGNYKLEQATITLADGTIISPLTGKCGRYATWRIEGDTITIHGSGGMYDWGYDAPWKDYLDIIKHVIIEEGITDTGDFCYFAAETAQLPESLTRIGSDSFCGYQGSTITIPSNVQIIAESAFTDSLLETIYIPRSVYQMEANSFARCNLLTEINVDPYNEWYKSIDGVVYTNDGKGLIVCPAGKQGDTYSVKDGTEIIGWAAFRSSDFVNIELPEGVTAITGQAFLSSTNLETITIPYTVTEIGYSAFKGCNNLKTVNYTGTQQQWNDLLAAADTSNNEALFNAEVKFVSQSGGSTPVGQKCGDNAAWRIENDTLIISGTGSTYDYDYEPGKWAPWNGEDYDKVVIEKGITHLGMLTGFGRSVSVSLPEGLKSIGYGALEYFNGSELKLPSTLEVIEPYGVGMSQNLVSVYIPANVHTIHGSSFAKAESLKNIEVDENNRYFESVDGMVYRKADNALVAVPAAVPFETVTVREGTKVIGNEAFWGAYINKVVLPDTVETLQLMAFKDCKYLTEITIPASVKVIEYNAFRGCTDLEKVNYGGTQEQWDELKRNSPGNDPLFNAEVKVCENAEGTVDGLSWKLESGRFTISGKGAIPDFTRREDAPWYRYKDSIKNVVIEEGITRVGNRAFASYKLDSVSLPDGLISVGVEAFVDYKGSRINLPDTIQVLEARSFAFAHNVEQVFIPRGLHSISETAFSSSGIEFFNVAPANPVYKSDNGVIYTENGKILFAFPTGRYEPFVVPDFVETIGEYAFWGASVQAVTGMENVRTIGDRAFYVAEQLNTVAIPKDIDYIGWRAFDHNNSLRTVITDATMEQWNNICDNLPEDNEYLKNAGVYAETAVTWELARVWFDYLEFPLYYIPAGYPMLEIPVTEVEGLEFMGWWTDKNGRGEQLTPETIITEDTDYYSHFVKGVPAKITGLAVKDVDGNPIKSPVKLEYFTEEPVFLMVPEVKGEGRYSTAVDVNSSDESVVTAEETEDGVIVVTAHKAGKATVTVTSRENTKFKATVTFNVTKVADDAEMTLKGLTKTENGTYRTTIGTKLTPVITWIGGQAWSEYEIVIPEEYSEVLGYDAKGNIVAIGTGYGEICIPGTNAWVGVEVFAEKVKGVQASATKVVLDQTIGLSGKVIEFFPVNEGACGEFEFTWTENPAIRVFAEGSSAVYVEAVSSEKASVTITAKATDGSGKTAKVTVQTGVIVRALQPTSAVPAKLAVGKSAKVTLNVFPADATIKAINWYAVDPDTYEDSDVVSVKGGTVKALKPGVAIVRAEPADGWGAVFTFPVEVTAAAQKVVIGDGAKTVTVPLHEQRVPLRLPVTVYGTTTDENGKKVDTTEGIEQKVNVSVAGDMAKYISCWYDENTNELVIGTGPATKGTVTVTTTDGTNKKATINVVYEEHITTYGFGIQAPKGVALSPDRSEWTVKEGTTLKPIVLYNGSDKPKGLPKAMQKFEIIVSDEEAFDINNAKGTFKAKKAGIYDVTFRYTGGCDECPQPNDVTITVEVLAKTAVNLKDPSISLPAAIRSVGMVGPGDIVATLAEGAQVQLTGLVGGQKPAGVNTEWKVYSLDFATGEKGEELVGGISKTGKLNLKGCTAGETYVVEFKVSDKKNPENFNTAQLFVEVSRKPVPAEITLVNMETGESITETQHKPSDAEENFVLAGIEGTAPAHTYEVKSASPKVATVEEKFDGNTGEKYYAVKYVGTGTANITVTAADGSNVKATIKVKVVKHDVPVSAITMPVKAVTVTKGQHIAIDYTVKGNAKTGEAASNPAILWTLDKNAYFVNETGEYITQEAEGTVYILTSGSNTGKVTLTGKALDGSGKTVKVTITVVKRAEGKAPERLGITFPANTANDGMPGAAVLTWGKSLGLKLNAVPPKADTKAVVWEVYCFNEEIMDWDADMAAAAGITVKGGKVNVPKPSAKITPYTGDIRVVAKLPYEVSGLYGDMTDMAAEVFIKVKAPIDKLTIADAPKTLGRGESVQLVAEFTRSPLAGMAGYPMLWSVNDKKLAEIDENGCLVINEDAAVGKTVKVTVQTMDGTGKKATVSIKIAQ